MPRPNLDRVREALRGTEFEGRAWIVGGAVRDQLLKRKHKGDVDIVTTVDALAAAETLWQTKVATIPPVTYPRFGTAMVQIEGATLEFATARKESYEHESRKPDVEPATIEQDALRRDFTVNAIMEDLFTGEISDPLGTGRRDLERRILRTPRDPVQTFHDDPLRMLRAVRFSWQLGFDPADGLYDAIEQEAHRLQIISAERIREELTKMLHLADGHECLYDLMDLGLLDQFIPEFKDAVGMDQGPYHHLDVWSHTVEVVANTDPRDLALRLAALFHDIAKPICKKEENGKTTFHGHDTEGERVTREVMARLKFSNDEIDVVAMLVRHHMRFLGMKDFTDSAARRVLRDLKDQTERLIELCEADSAAHAPGTKRPDFDHIRDVLIRVAEQTPIEKLDSPISGERIMRVTGLPEGEQIGKIKRHLSDLVVEGKLLHTDTEGAEREAARFVGNRNNV